MEIRHTMSGVILAVAAFTLSVPPAQAFGDQVVGVSQGGDCTAIIYFDFSKIAATFSFSYKVSLEKECSNQGECKEAMKIVCQGANKAQCQKDKTAQCEKEKNDLNEKCKKEAYAEQQDQEKNVNQICRLLGHDGLLGQDQQSNNKCAKSEDPDLKTLKTYGVSTKGGTKGTAALQWAFCYTK